MSRKRYLLAALLGAALIVGIYGIGCRSGATSARIWEESITIPTYQPEAAGDLAPVFYHGRAYQGAQGPIYPYPMQDKLSKEKKDKNYKAVYLENKYVKICVLPEIGGRIMSAVDKSNNYDYIYHQHVVKPALIGMLGAWISGGAEWSIPHHHRASALMPAQYKTEENADGSKTVWVGEMEIRHRMRWAIGLTLFPDKSYLKVTTKLINQTPISNSFLYFANVGVHTNLDYQVIFPPSQEMGTYHSKVDFVRWPIADGVFQRRDFTGQDVSWWKTHLQSISIFAHQPKEDFFGGYDHSKKAGILLIGDHSVQPGMKFYTWGGASYGRAWDARLTDEDGPYLELMQGGYSDNQPDYSWIQPYETKRVDAYWYPFQQLGIVKKANKDAAVNLDVTPENVAKIGVHVTAEHGDARLLLKSGEQTLLEKTFAIDPGKPFLTEFTLPAGVKKEDLKVTVMAGKDELISYQTYQRRNPPMPPVAQPPLPPKDIKTNQELTLSGLRLQEFHSPTGEPYPYYEEALKRDPQDVQANTELGILYLKRGMFKEAEERLQIAVNRLTKDYVRPKDCEALYYLGMALKYQGKNAEAYEPLYASTWDYSWRTAGYYALAELACIKGDLRRALEFIDHSIESNGLSSKSYALKALILRKMGSASEAEKMAAAALAIDPLDPWAERERRLARNERPHSVYFAPDFWNDDVQLYQETAVNMANAGMWEDGISTLNDLVAAYPDKSRVYPMVYYWLGYLNEEAGKAEEAARCYGLANQMPADYCFPFRVESIKVLNRAMEKNPQDARAPYYLGNLLYDFQPKEAIKAWEKSRSLDDKFAMVHRNLADAYTYVEEDNPKAIASLETALSLQAHPRFLLELDALYEAAGEPATKRLATFEKYEQAAVKRDDVLSSQIALYVYLGQLDKAMDLLKTRQFDVWEGGGRNSPHDSYVDALLLKGHDKVKAKQYAEAIKDYEEALKYHQTATTGIPGEVNRVPAILYFIGTAYEGMGDAQMAKTTYEKAVTEVVRVGEARFARGRNYAPEVLHYQARALQKLGRAAEAAKAFNRLIEVGQQSLQGTKEVSYFAKFAEKQANRIREADAHYVIGLGYLGTGRRDDAKAQFNQTLKLNDGHIGAKTELVVMGSGSGTD